MESANLHHQDQFVGSSSLSTPSFYGTGANSSWNQNLILNAGNLDLNVNGSLSNSRGSSQTNVNYLVPSSIDTSMIQDLGYHWLGNRGNFPNQTADHDLHHSSIKEELSDSANKFGGTINCVSSDQEDYHQPSTSYMKHDRQDLHDLTEKVLLRTFSSGCQPNQLEAGGALYYNSPNSPSFGCLDSSNKGSLNQIFPSANISNINSPFLSSSNMNLQVLDLLTSSEGFDQLGHNNVGLLKEAPSFDIDHLRETSHWSATSSPHKVSSFMNGVAEIKRSSSGVSEPKASHTASKKPRFESRSSLAPFKVRKEKLGDRIAALQQLVAPFGKTDTASVLIEAIGYIKFLQDQVETLSVPYMKTSCNNARRSIQEDSVDVGEDEQKRNLRSRGLCLVPMTCMSYIAGDNINGQALNLVEEPGGCSLVRERYGLKN